MLEILEEVAIFLAVSEEKSHMGTIKKKKKNKKQAGGEISKAGTDAHVGDRSGKTPLLRQPCVDGGSSGQGLEAWKPFLEHAVSWAGGVTTGGLSHQRGDGGYHHFCSPNPLKDWPAIGEDAQRFTRGSALLDLIQAQDGRPNLVI